MNPFVRSLLLATGVVAASASPAAAHADPTVMSPAACASVESVDEVRMEFTEELEIIGSTIEVFVDGALIASAGPDLADLDRTSIVAALPEGTSGVVEVEWTSVSAIDDDTTTGRYAFVVGGSIDGIECGDGSNEESGSGNTSLIIILGLTAVAVAGVVGVARRPAPVEV